MGTDWSQDCCSITSLPGRHRAKLRVPPGPYTVDFHLAAVPPGKLAAEPVQHRPALPARCPQVRAPGPLAPLLLCSTQDMLG